MYSLMFLYLIKQKEVFALHHEKIYKIVFMKKNSQLTTLG